MAPHVALETTLGPTSTTQRPLSSFLIACLAHNAALERTRRALLPLKNNYKELPQRELATPESGTRWSWAILIMGYTA